MQDSKQPRQEDMQEQLAQPGTDTAQEEGRIPEEAWNAFLDRLERHSGHKVDRSRPPLMTPEQRAKMQELQEKLKKLSKEELWEMRLKAQKEEEEERGY